jgi:tetratricopeptide (TPR) repeat protein
VSRALENLLLVAAIGGGGYLAWQHFAAKPAPPVAAAPPAPAAPPAAPHAPAPPPAMSLAAAAPPVVEVVSGAAGLPPADVAAAQALTLRVNQREPLFSADLRVAEDLFTRYPAEPRLRDLLEATLVTLAGQERGQRRYAEAAAQCRRAIAVHPGSLAPRRALAIVLFEGSDWSGAEAAAREALQLQARDADMLEVLAESLFHQDRNREAIEAFRAVLELADNPSARGYLQRLEKDARDEGGMTERQLAHFHVRYDGEEHLAVGQEILRALERHYATLAITLDHQPRETIAVILFTREQYYQASGAPAWSGGVFDQIDGRIRIPIGGLTTSLTPDIDNVVVHELTHAFIHDRSAGLAPRAVHEGLAQWMEGERLESKYSADQVQALAEGRTSGVGSDYAMWLAFVEYLQAQRGQGGINDLLRTLAERGDVDAAFRDVYGQDFRATQQRFYERLRQRYAKS